MSAARDILKNFNLFVDGRGFAGNADEIQLPALNLQVEDYRAGGMDAPVGLDMGMEKLEMSFILSRYEPNTIAQFGLGNASEVPITARGALEDRAGNVTALVVQARGTVKGLEHGAWQPGARSALTFSLDLTFYRYILGGRIVHEIDVINMVRRIDGVDRLAAQRAALGI